MKTNSLIIVMLAALSTAFTSCEKDDMPGPDAKVFGSIKDKATGNLVETDLINGSFIEAFELGYETPIAQRWLIKNNGEYRNDLVFSNNYRFNLPNGNFFPVSMAETKVVPGDNQIDFQVDPYIRIKNCNIVFDQAGKKVVATFTLEGGNAAVKVRSIRLYAFSDMYVGEPIKFSTAGTAFSQSFTPSKLIDNSTITLSIDLVANAGLFPSGRSYFFRVGALADVTGVGTIRHNYAPNVKITL